jgi:hypothetical protein
MNELRGLDNWITGVSDTTNPRSPYYTGPEFDLMICPCGCEFSTENTGDTRCPDCGSTRTTILDDRED